MSSSRTVIAAAQMCAWDENIEQNLREHERLIRLAAAHDVQLLVFPEMSITGYVREAAERLAFASDDQRLGTLKQLAALHGMILVAGAPVRLGEALHIGAFILYPDGTEALYTKHYLYEGEDEYYTPNHANAPVILLGGEKIAPAICFDIENRPHIEQAKSAGSTVYAPGIFYSEPSIAGAHSLLASYAREFSLSVLLSNFSGQLYHAPCGGQSAFWGPDGTLLASLGKDGTGLVLGIRENGVWTGKTAVDGSDIYTVCPVYHSPGLTLRLTVAEDGPDLLKCYSDEKAVPLFNSDNCNGDDFHYTTLDRLRQTMDLWEYSYKNRRFVRWSVLDRKTNEVVGTLECFGRTMDMINGIGALLRIDLRSDCETQPILTEILEIVQDSFFGAFDADAVITKAVPTASVRLLALHNAGFQPLSGKDDYYIKHRV